MSMLFDDGAPLALIVKRYISQFDCNVIEENIRELDIYQNYSFAPALPITKVGVLFGEACTVPQLMDEYFRSAIRSEQQLKKAFCSVRSPLSKLRDDLAKLWTNGTLVPEMGGRRMAPGTIRRTTAPGGIPKHADSLIDEYPSTSWTPRKELVANVYIKCPSPGLGGELRIYSHSPTYVDDPGWRDRVSNISTQTEEALVNASFVTIAPQAGDLIIFNGRNAHEVLPVHRGERVSACCHIGFVSQEEPLHCWI